MKADHVAECESGHPDAFHAKSTMLIMMFVSVHENQITESDKNVLAMLGFPTFVPCKSTTQECHGFYAVLKALC